MRQLALALLNDDHGISEEAWEILRGFLADHQDVLNAVRSCDGRFYIDSETTLF